MDSQNNVVFIKMDKPHSMINDSNFKRGLIVSFIRQQIIQYHQ